MYGRKNKISVSMLVAGGFLSAYIGYLVNGAWKKGMDILEFSDSFNQICQSPFANYLNANTPKAILIALLIYVILILMYITSKRNYMPGQEYGTARWADYKEINLRLKGNEKNRMRILSQNIRMSYNSKAIKYNNNTLVFGGSGAGKTYFYAIPNLLQMPKNVSLFITDPKSEILRETGSMFQKNGYRVRVLNLVDMNNSDCYNPFVYIREQNDIPKLVTNLINNTTDKNKTGGEEFWVKSEILLLQSVFYYVWLEMPLNRRNFKSVMKLMAEAEVNEKEKSKLTRRMEKLARESDLGEEHPAVVQYVKLIKTAGDTLKSIIISVNVRLAPLDNPAVLRVLSRDEMDIAELGCGVNFDGETPTVTYLVIPDSDSTYNFIVGIYFLQLYQELYYRADNYYDGKLPLEVHGIHDEFANISMPEEFLSLLATMRGRGISATIILQNIAQIKAMYKDKWEIIPGNCDTAIYLGGNEQSTHKYISELLGKATIDKKATGETRGRQGSASRNYDVIGRELMTPDEVRKMPKDKCVVIVNGLDPIYDSKYDTLHHPNFGQCASGGGKAYVHKRKKGANANRSFSLLNEASIKHFEEQKQKGDKVCIDSLTYEEFMMLGSVELQQRFKVKMEEEQKNDAMNELGFELTYNPDSDSESDNKISKRSQRRLKDDSIVSRISNWDFSTEQKTELKEAIKTVPESKILEYLYPETTVEQMVNNRKAYESSTKR